VADPTENERLPTARETINGLVKLGQTPEKARLLVEESLGFTIPTGQMDLTAKELKRRAEQIKQRRSEPTMSVDNESRFKTPGPSRGIVQTVGVPIAQAFGVATTAFEPLSDEETSSVVKTFQDSYNQLEKETDVRMERDAAQNFIDNVSAISEGTVDFFKQVIGAKPPQPQAIPSGVVDTIKQAAGPGPGSAIVDAILPDAEAVYGAYRTGRELPGQMMAGGAAFLARLAADPRTFYTHPADAFLTMAPMLPSIANSARLGNAKAIKALKELEDAGVLRSVAGGDVAQLAVRGTRAALEAPGKVLDAPLPGPLKSQVRAPVQMTDAGLTGGSRARTFRDLATSALKGAGVGVMADEVLLGALVGASPAALAPAVQALKRYRPELAEAARESTRFGDLPERGVSALFKAVEAVDGSMLRRWFTDVAAMDNARAEALLREAIQQPDRFAQRLTQDIDLLASLAEKADTKTGFELASYEPELGTAVTVRDHTGVPMPDSESALLQRLGEGSTAPLVAKLGPDEARVIDRIADTIAGGLSKAREDLSEGVKPQQDLRDRYVTQIREVWTGNAPGYLDEPSVNGAVMKYLVDLGMEPSMAGAQLRLADSEWRQGRRVVQIKGIPPKVEGGNWTEVNIRDVIAKAVEKSPEAKRTILEKTAAGIVKNEAVNQRTKLIADTANPLVEIFEERWLKSGGVTKSGARKEFNKILTEKPEVFTDIIVKMYELEKGLVPGAPVMFLPMQGSGLTVPNLTANLQGRHITTVAQAISEKHGISLEAAKREVRDLRDRKLFGMERVDELGGYLDPTVAKAFDRIDAAEKFRDNVSSDLSRWSKKLKKNLTVLNVSSGVNNITANVLLQSVSRGVPMSAIIKELGQTGLSYRRFKAGKLDDPGATAMYRALERTGLLDSDMIAVETHLYKGESLPQRLAKPFEKFYRQGDALPKLEEASRVYKKSMSQLDMLKDGESVAFMVDTNKVVPIKRTQTGFEMKGRALSADELADIVARGSAMAAENKFFNYSDTGALSKKVLAKGESAFVSPFYTWFSKALAGRRGGLVGNVLLGDFSPILSTDSTAITRAQLADATLQSGKRAMFTQVGDIEERAARDGLRQVVGYKGIEEPTLMTRMKDGAIGVTSLQGVNFAAPFILGLRAGFGALSIGRGDTSAEKLNSLMRKRQEGESVRSFQRRKRRAFLALKQIRGERLSGKNSLELLGLAGGPMLDILRAIEEDGKNEYGYSRTGDELFAALGSALIGGTVARGIQTARAAISEKGVFGHLPAGVSLDPARKEELASFMARRMISLFAPRPVRVKSLKKSKRTVTSKGVKRGKAKSVIKGAAEYQVKAVREALTKGTIGEIESELKDIEGSNLQIDKIERKRLQALKKLWKNVIPGVIKDYEDSIPRNVAEFEKISRE